MTKKITKIATPVDFHFLSDKREEFRQRLLTEGRSPREICDELSKYVMEQNESAMANHQKVTASEFLISTLLSHCAQKVYLIDVADGGLGKATVSKLPAFLRNRMVVADENKKIRDQISKLSSQFFHEINPAWEDMARKNNLYPDDVNGHEHAICVLDESLKTLAIATKYDCEADVDLELTYLAIARIRAQLKSSETLALLSRIEGVFNCYDEPSKVPGLKVSVQQSPSLLLKELLADSKMISLSQTRFLLGIPSKAELVLMKLRQKTKEALSIGNNRLYFSMAQKIGNIATRPFGVEMPELSIEKDTEFVPPLFALGDYKPNCLATIRALPTIMPSDDPIKDNCKII